MKQRRTIRPGAELPPSGDPQFDAACEQLLAEAIAELDACETVAQLYKVRSRYTGILNEALREIFPPRPKKGSSPTGTGR